MSQENVESSKRAVDAFNRRDVKAWLEELDPETVLHLSLFAMFGGESTVYRGHDGVPKLFRDLDEAFAEFQIEISEIRDMGERTVAFGHLHAVGKASGVKVESPIGYVVEYRNGKQLRVDDYFDREQALEAAGLSE